MSSRAQPYFERVPGAPEPLSHTIRRRVRFSDLDPVRIVWHGRYPLFFEEAQIELGKVCGLSFPALKQADIVTPVVQFHLDYKLPLVYDELFSVTASLVWTDSARINTEFIIRKEDGRIASTGYTVQLFANAESLEPLWFSPDLWENCKRRWLAGEFHA